MNTGPAVTMGIGWTLEDSTRNELLDMNVDKHTMMFEKV
jgi:hypothetical protein